LEANTDISKAKIVMSKLYSKRFATFIVWTTLVGLVFFSIYPTTNWLAGLRDNPYCLFFTWELRFPLIPEFIWLYLSMYLLFALPPFFLTSDEMKRLAKKLITATCLAGLAFLTLPARLGFPRVVPSDSPYREIFQTLFAIDKPFNLVPSLHVVYSAAIILAIAGRLGKTGRIALFGWLALVLASTILIHQHHLLDVCTGLVLALLMHSYWERRKKHA
jgi:membrane-associated phospholipid phosphatase